MIRALRLRCSQKLTIASAVDEKNATSCQNDNDAKKASASQFHRPTGHNPARTAISTTAQPIT